MDCFAGTWGGGRRLTLGTNGACMAVSKAPRIVFESRNAGGSTPFVRRFVMGVFV